MSNTGIKIFINDDAFEMDTYPPHPQLDEKLWILFFKRKKGRRIEILYTIEFGNGVLDITKRTYEEDTEEVKAIVKEIEERIRPIAEKNIEDIKIEDIDILLKMLKYGI